MGIRIHEKGAQMRISNLNVSRWPMLNLAKTLVIMFAFDDGNVCVFVCVSAFAINLR